MRSIVIYGATDRFNYGDLLFPIILSHAAKLIHPGCRIENVSIKKSDFLKRGGLPTKSMRNMISSGELDEFDRIIIAGGQVLNASWTTIISYLGPDLNLSLRVIRKFFGKAKADIFARYLSGIPWHQPFVIPSGFFKNGSVAYNAVGGVSIEQLPADYLSVLLRSVEAADYVSVRDKATQEAFGRLGVEVHLVPDSAVVMSSIFSKNTLFEKISPHVSEYLSNNSGAYLVFQIGINFVKNREESIARTIECIARDQGLKVVLLAIGTAIGHEDQIALRNIRKHIGQSVDVFELYEGSIWEIMLMISEAAFYLGTSLHGAITAISFAVPHMPFTNQVVKLKEFLMTWDLPEQANHFDIDDHSKKLAKVLSTGAQARFQLRDRLMKQAWSGIEHAVGQ